MQLLFVCLGNICRSPTAEGVMRSLIERDGLEGEIAVDSAATGDWHVGHSPDRRASAAALARGVTLQGSARQITAADFARFDLILAMDRSNESDLRLVAPDEAGRAKVRLLREFDPASDGADVEVPDPYYGGADGFDEVFDLVLAACEGLLAEIRSGSVR